MSPARVSTPQTHLTGNALLRGIMAVPRNLAAWVRRHRTRQDLSHLEPHLLRDIGLDDLTVAAECAKPFWRP